MRECAWLSKINLPGNWTIEHIHQIISLWVQLREVHFIWARKMTSHGSIQLAGYSVASAYNVQFLGLSFPCTELAVWKAYPPSPEFGLSIDWKNGGGQIVACAHKREPESVGHLLFKCRFTIRLLGTIREWLHLHSTNPSSWSTIPSIQAWWSGMSDAHRPNWKVMASLTMLSSWVIWNERNARVFRHKPAPPPILLVIIKEEAALWTTAGDKYLGKLME